MTQSQRTINCLLLVLGVIVSIGNSTSTELTFELPDREEQCFYEEIEKDINVIFEFQVRSCHRQHAVYHRMCTKREVVVMFYLTRSTH